MRTRKNDMPEELWKVALDLPTYDGIYALISEESEDIYQDNNPDHLEEIADELELEDFWVIDLLRKDYRENIPERDWKFFERYPTFQRGEKILKNVKGTISDAVISERRGDYQ